MALSEQRWKRVSESPYPWEREALEYIRTNLNDQPPNFGWCNFTFIDELSTVGLNEVDCLVVTARGIFLIEIKSKRFANRHAQIQSSQYLHIAISEEMFIGFVLREIVNF